MSAAPSRGLEERPQGDSPARFLFAAVGSRGLGPQMRCIALAREVRRCLPNARMLIVTDAQDTRPIDREGLSRVSYPTLSAQRGRQRLAYLRLINDAVKAFEPAVFVEHGRTTDDYALIPALRRAHRSTLILEGRFAGEDLAEAQRLRAADLIIVGLNGTGPPPAGQHGPAAGPAPSRAQVTCGAISRIASLADRRRVRARYRLREKDRPILFIARRSDVEAKQRMFRETISVVSSQLAADAPTRRMIAILGGDGPRGSGCPEIEIVEYEPDLHALIAEAGCAVIGPSYSTLHECLFAGTPPVVVDDPATSSGAVAGSSGCARFVREGDTGQCLESVAAALADGPHRGAPSTTGVSPGTRSAARRLVSLLERAGGSPCQP